MCNNQHEHLSGINSIFLLLTDSQKFHINITINSKLLVDTSTIPKDKPTMKQIPKFSQELKRIKHVKLEQQLRILDSIHSMI